MAIKIGLLPIETFMKSSVIRNCSLVMLARLGFGCNRNSIESSSSKNASNSATEIFRRRGRDVRCSHPGRRGRRRWTCGYFITSRRFSPGLLDVGNVRERAIKVRRIRPKGALGPASVIAKIDISRSSGFPRMARLNDEVHFALDGVRKACPRTHGCNRCQPL